MADALAHTEPGRGVVGIWHLTGEHLDSEYLTDTDAAHERAQHTLSAKGTNVPWDVWFHRLAGRTPHHDDYVIVRPKPGEQITDLLHRLTTEH